MKPLVPLLAVLLGAGCVPSADVQGVAPQAAAVAIGQHARAGRFVVTPLSVFEDSRCPSGVRCIVAGRLTVLARVDGPRVHEVHAFTLGVPLPLQDTTVILTSAAPERFAEISLQGADYRLTFTGGR